jgi:hypothetical protein
MIESGGSRDVEDGYPPFLSMLADVFVVVVVVTDVHMLLPFKSTLFLTAHQSIAPGRVLDVPYLVVTLRTPRTFPKSVINSIILDYDWPNTSNY